MAAKVVMEALSPTMEEGRVVKWHKRAGEAVRAGETLAEIETDKAIMDLVARADGVLTEVSAPEGATVPVGREIAVIVDAGAEALPGSGPPPPVAAPAPSAPAPAPPTSRAVPEAPPLRPAVAEAPPEGPRRVHASPLARRIARETGVNLQVIAGSGPGGRIVKRDVDALREEPAAAPPAPRPPRPPAPPSPGPGPDGGYEDVPLTQMRKAIAQRLATSLGPIPHFFLTTEVDMDRASEARAAVNARRGPDDRISVNDILLKATALALTRHRSCNAWFGGDHIRYWRDVHLGMAVAVDDGLITPVIRHADRKSLSDIGREARTLAESARARRLRPPDYTGATFSVSNLGMFDIDQFGAVINPPEAGILAVGTIVSKPVAVEGQVTVRPRLRMTLSCDHRVIDGATGAAFLKTLKEMLENPLAMLL
jgi:pyruvate dehydrogenase E2 component (dihydrolipoamide acetyltransferase)